MIIKIENHELKVDGKKIADLPKLTRDSKVSVYSVPAEYRENEIFFSAQEDGQPEEVPACTDYQLLAVLELEPHDDAVLEQAKKETLERAIADADDLLEVLEKDCAEREIKTWDQQAIEAASPNGAADLGLTNTIAKYRGIDPGELRDRVSTKSFMYKDASGAIIGSKQYVEDRIEEAQDLDELFAIVTVRERLSEAFS